MNIKRKLLGFFAAALLPFTMAGTANAGLNDGLAAYWTFDEGVGIVANDVSGNGNTGAINGGATFGPGHVNTGLNFNGVDQNVVVPDAASLNPSTSLTISAFVQPSTSTGDIVTKDGENAGGRQYQLTFYNSHFWLSIGTTTGLHTLMGNGTWATGGQYHVAMTYDGATVKLFVNGALDGSLPVTGAVVSGNQPVRIGGGAPAGQSPYWYSGGIDEVKIYARALADCEVARVAGSTAQCLVPAVQSTNSPSQHFELIDPELQQDIVDYNYGGLGTAWTADGRMLRRANGQIVEYSATQSFNTRGTDMFNRDIIHNVPGLPAGHGMTNGTDGFLYANSPEGLYKVDPNTWAATRVGATYSYSYCATGYWAYSWWYGSYWVCTSYGTAQRGYGYHYGIGTLSDGRIVREVNNTVWMYNPANGTDVQIFTESNLIDDLTTVSTPAGDYIALASRYKQQVVIIDPNGNEINRVNVRGYIGTANPDGMAFGGGSLYTGNTDGSVSRFDFTGPGFTGTASEVIVAYHAGGYGDLSTVGPDGAFYMTQNQTRYDDGSTTGGWTMIRLSIPGGFDTPPGVPSNKAPTANAGVAQTVECTGAASANATLNGGASTDPDGDALLYSWSWSGGSASGVSPTASFPLGTTQVTLTVDDQNGHTATSTTSVKVQDTTPPTVNAGPDVVLEATGPSGTLFDLMAQVTTSDNCCSPNVQVINSPPYNLGVTTVTVRATDCSGNTASDTMLVTVQDTTPPLLAVPANVSIEANGVLSTVDLGVALASDLFNPVTISNDAPATFPLGTSTVTYTATDHNGLTTTGTQTVTVVDTTAPALTLPANVTAEATGILTPVTIGAATATDIFNVTVTSDAPALFGLGDTTVNWTATDANGNVSTGTQTVTVADTTAPVLTVPGNVSIEANGVLSTVDLGVATATDIFGATVANDAPATFGLGTTVVTYTATDGNGLTSTGTQTVTVQDTIAPVLTVPADYTTEARGLITFIPKGAVGRATATDATSVKIALMGAGHFNKQGFSLGTTPVTWVATDMGGNVTEGIQNIIVVDTTAPVLTVPADVSIEANGVLSSVNLGVAKAKDIFAVTITNDAPATGFPVGTTAVTWTATDANGNATTGTQNVTVADSTAPVLTVPADVSVEANGVLSTVSIGSATATDIFAVTVTSDAPATYALGTTVVTWTATDANGNATTGTQNVTVVDTTAPVLTVPADVSVEANGVLSTVDLGVATATDIFGATVVNDAPATFPLGSTTVTYTATDGNGLTTTATQTVTVVDTTAPVLTVPADVSVEANGVLSTVDLGVATATDIFGATVVNDAPATFPLGSTTVTYTATDGNGLTTTATQTVTVVDTTAPVLTVPADVSVEANAVMSTVAIGNATATDIFAVTITSDAPATYALGTTVVTWTATDANGNATSGTQNVTVVDTTAPVLTVPADVSVEANAVMSTVAIGNATATDIFAVTITSDAPATYALGTTVVTWTATDANGNATSGTQNVTVVDTTAPVLSVPADVSVEANGVLSTVAIGTATATDIFGATVTNDAPATYPVGTTVVTYTAVDGNGLTTIGTQNVTVVDTTAPTVTAQLVPVLVGDDEHENQAKKGLFQVVFTATDIADPNPVLTATLNGATVTNGQIVKLEQSKKAKVENEHGKLEIQGLSFTLSVSATDASGNVGTASAAFAFPSHKDDDHGIHRGNDKEDKHADSGNHKSEGKAKVEQKDDKKSESKSSSKDDDKKSKKH